MLDITYNLCYSETRKESENMSDRELHDVLQQYSQDVFNNYPVLLIFENQEQMDCGQIKNINTFNKSRYICYLTEEITEDLSIHLKSASYILL